MILGIIFTAVIHVAIVACLSSHFCGPHGSSFPFQSLVTEGRKTTTSGGGPLTAPTHSPLSVNVAGVSEVTGGAGGTRVAGLAELVMLAGLAGVAMLAALLLQSQILTAGWALAAAPGKPGRSLSPD